jgi:hypothetical protein
MRQIMKKKRARDLGLDFDGMPGPFNAITDVSGVLVGYSTLIEGVGDLRQGGGPIRTGVTAILPHGRSTEMRPTWAGFHALNGNTAGLSSTVELQLCRGRGLRFDRDIDTAILTRLIRAVEAA